MKIEISRKTFEKLIKAHTNYSLSYDNNVLNNICVKAEKGVLKFATTDGNRMLVSELNIDEKEKFKPTVYCLSKLAAIKFSKAYKNLINDLEIEFTENEMIIKDLSYQTTYRIPKIDYPYPKYEQLFPKINSKKYLKIGINKKYLSDVNLLINNERSNIIEIIVNKKNDEAPILIESKNEEYEIKQTSLIMPIRIKD